VPGITPFYAKTSYAQAEEVMAKLNATWTNDTFLAKFIMLHAAVFAQISSTDYPHSDVTLKTKMWS